MARKPKVVATPKRLLPPDWRDDGRWKITAMLARISQDEYLSEARAFENHHICHQTMSDDWHKTWQEWAFTKFRRPNQRCAFCGQETEDGRVVQINPATADAGPEFRWFCNTGHQANWETNQPKPRRHLFA